MRLIIAAGLLVTGMTLFGGRSAAAIPRVRAYVAWRQAGAAFEVQGQGGGA